MTGEDLVGQVSPITEGRRFGLGYRCWHSCSRLGGSRLGGSLLIHRGSSNSMRVGIQNSHARAERGR